MATHLEGAQDRKACIQGGPKSKPLPNDQESC